MSVKAEAEIQYWRQTKEREKGGVFSHSHFENFYTAHFNLDKSFYRDKRVLDIGCGPRGSLEWADNTLQRVGLDPLAKSYKQLGIGGQKMLYVSSPAEDIPFPDEYFDIVTSFNSLDHVDDIEKTIGEIIRVIKPGGLFLLLTDVNHKPTPAEPNSFSWDILEKFAPAMRVLESRHYEKSQHGIYQSIDAAVAYDHTNTANRYGVLSAKLQKSS
jgi:ubiquinone/menaquinone biosynthesis C-methylase UbiE